MNATQQQAPTDFTVESAPMIMSNNANVEMQNNEYDQDEESSLEIEGMPMAGAANNTHNQSAHGLQ